MHPGSTPSAPPDGVVSFWRSAGLGRCPRCGQGRLFQGLLTARPACDICGLAFPGQEVGDGPAVLGIFVLGALTVIGAFLLEFRLEPPFWVHLLLWPALLIPGSILTSRFAKAALVALAWRRGARP